MTASDSLNRRPHRIRSRLILSFGLLALLIILVMTFFNFMFVYTVEDKFFDRMVEDEKEYIVSTHARTGKLTEPRQTLFEVYTEAEQLPADLVDLYREGPLRTEFQGEEGRHYHVTVSDTPDFILVAEVSDSLVVRNVRRALFTILAVVSLVLLLVASLVALLLGNRLARPIERLAQLFDRADARDLPTAFAREFPNNEIGVLARGMERMVHRVNAFIAREQDFTRDVSHELRTPVSVLKGALEVAHKQGGSLDAQLFERMQRAVLAMEQNIETLLALAREEVRDSGETVRLLPIVERAVIEHAHLLGDSAVDVELTVAPTFQVAGSPGLLQILFNNLISNAFQHTISGRVTIAEEADHTVVVSDTGAGIDPDIGEEVFRQFVKGKTSGGVGVGLSIVKRLCESQGWEIQLQSSGEGTVVTVRFKA